ncbi:extracellular solute-binding protein [Ruania alba]|uniref:Carbohydrate ABC transporter substrate-binding protein, CUT1 family n=1 Tax=Ruania alba TaxID=648782 RepID=A0A1H5N673_9MICO|nr:extracellular solute-binding protein [Ruania alba]SEE96397.1 carbohydrate ABC transporter substrate-binding protein, CUT1 family [Ruania alba]
MSGAEVSRRRVIQGFGGAALLGTTGALAACGGGSGSSGNESSSGTGGGAPPAEVVPNFVASSYVEPDLPGTEEGVQSGFLSYPAEPTRVHTEAPGKGGTISALTFTWDAAAPALGQNAYWQELNERLGVELDLTYSPGGDYPNKFATTIAGGDVPDLTVVRTPQPNLPDLLEAQFQDLSEYLGGSAVEQYPSLAALPTISWKACVFGGRLFGIPIPRPLVGTVLFARRDILQDMALPEQPADFAEFREMVGELSDPSSNRWAFADPGAGLQAVKEMLHLPTTWMEDGGSFTHVMETEEYKQVLADVTEMWSSGIFHPDSLSANNNQRNDWFTAGTIVLNRAGAAGWNKFYDWGADVPGYEPMGMVIPGYDGGPGGHTPGSVHTGMLSLKQADSARIEEMLAIADYLATPFGTEEHLFRYFGEQGVHYELEGTDPILTDQGSVETVLPVKYLGDAEGAIYAPGNEAATRSQHEFQSQVIPNVMADPTVGLFSNLDATDGNTINGTIRDFQTDIIAGRRSLEEWDDQVTAWREAGGDAIRAEYEEAFAEANG